MERIDAHLHVWSLGRGDYAWPGPDLPILYRDYRLREARETVAQAGIDRIVLVQATPTIAETEWLLQLAQDDPIVAGVVGWVDLTADDAAETLERLAASPRFKGVRAMIQQDPDSDALEDSRLDPALDALERLGLALDLLVRPRHLPAAARLAARRPGLTLVLDHAGKPETGLEAFPSWAADLAAFADGPSTFCKLSGLVTEFDTREASALQAHVDLILELFSPERVLWGSDWPVVRLICDYQAWDETTRALIQHLNETDRRRILGGTAIHAYSL